MKTFVIALLLLSPLAFESGCVRKVAEDSKSVQHSDGTVTEKSNTVYQNADGTTTTVKQQSTH